MKTTLNLKNELIAEAMAITGLNEKTAVIHLALEELINKAARQRLALLGGTHKAATAPPRQRLRRARILRRA